MGRFFRNLKGQIARDTGRVITGWLYKDKHASVFRRAQNNTEEKKPIANKVKQIEEEEVQDLEMARLSDEVRHRSQKVEDREIPKQQQDLVEYLIGILSEMYGYGWQFEFSEKSKIINSYSDMLYYKLRQGLFLLERHYPECRDYSYLNQQYKKYRRVRFIKKYTIHITVVSAFLILLLLTWLY